MSINSAIVDLPFTCSCCIYSSPDDPPPADKPPDEDSPPPVSDSIKVDYTLRGKTVSYYRPDEYVGKTLSGDAPQENLKLDWV